MISRISPLRAYQNLLAIFYRNWLNLTFKKGGHLLLVGRIGVRDVLLIQSTEKNLIVKLGLISSVSALKNILSHKYSSINEVGKAFGVIRLREDPSG